MENTVKINNDLRKRPEPVPAIPQGRALLLRATQKKKTTSPQAQAPAHGLDEVLLIPFRSWMVRLAWITWWGKHGEGEGRRMAVVGKHAEGGEFVKLSTAITPPQTHAAGTSHGPAVPQPTVPPSHRPTVPPSHRPTVPPSHHILSRTSAGLQLRVADSISIDAFKEFLRGVSAITQ
jgi:hypothetical protein